MIVHADGRYDPHGACTWAFLVFSDGGERIHAANGDVQVMAGEVTSLLAEWAAAVAALRWVRDEAVPEALLLRVDAALVAKALTDDRVVAKGIEAPLVEEARRLVHALRRGGVSVRVERVPRWRNFEADGLAFAAAGADASEADPSAPGVPPPSWREYGHRDKRGRIRGTKGSGP